MSDDEKAVEAAIPDYDAAGEVATSEGGEGWHSDLPRVEFKALLGKRILIEEVTFRNSDYDTPAEGQAPKQYALILFRSADAKVPGELDGNVVEVAPGEQATTSCGGVRVVDQLRRTKDFPIKTEVGQEKTTRGYQMLVLN